MPRSATTGVFLRVSNSFSNPVFGTLIDPTDADALFDDQDDGLNPANFAGPLNIIAATTLGKAGTTVGTLGFFNATSGSITISPPTGALGTVTLTLPDLTDNLVSRASTDTLTNKTLTSPAINGATILTSTYNKVTITAPATSATLTLIDGTTLTGPAASGTVMTLGNTETVTGAKTFSNAANTYSKVTITAPATSATLTLIDGTTLTGPAASGTVMTLGNNETVTGVKTFGAAGNVGKLVVAGTTSGSTILNATAVASGTLTLPAATDTLVGKATTDTLTNKTFNSTGTGNVLQVSSVTVSAGQYPGEPTTGNATAGNVGEFVVSNIANPGSSITSGVTANITSISLTAGDWDVRCAIGVTGAGTTTVGSIQGGPSLTSATFDSTNGRNASNWYNNATVFANVSVTIPTMVSRFSLSSTTTVFLVVNASFGVSTATAYGNINARRVR